MIRAVVICPGRGTYNKSELGSLARLHSNKGELLDRFDAIRRENQQPTLRDLDGAAHFKVSEHSRGDNASALIYAATYADFLSIDKAKIDIVAVTGNSMGWYSALACAGALNPQDGFRLANGMGTLMQDAMIGGQLVYPFIGPDWQPDQSRKALLLGLVNDINARSGHELSLSIDLGGMLVLAGNREGLKAFEDLVPVVQERFPLRLANHAAFHTPLQQPVALQGQSRFPATIFTQPTVPLIDGRGAIWWPHASDSQDLWAYTLGYQVTQTYDFTHAIAIAAREFAPDMFIVTGPGTTLGGAVAQSLILSGWQGMGSKQDFEARQADASLLIAMGRDDQRQRVV
jgi:[acyl-carrier-protein] S-malonyltransferase